MFKYFAIFWISRVEHVNFTTLECLTSFILWNHKCFGSFKLQYLILCTVFKPVWKQKILTYKTTKYSCNIFLCVQTVFYNQIVYLQLPVPKGTT